MDFEDQKESIRQAIKDQYQKDLPLIDVERMRGEFLEWLEQVKFPGYPGKSSWEDAIEVFPPSKDEVQLLDGTRLRLVLRLYTAANKYLIAVAESLKLSDRGIYTLSCHVNWKDNERRIQQVVDETYLGEFKEGLRSQHTLWAQTIRYGDVFEALSCCAAAILARELRPAPQKGLKTERVQVPQPVALDLPTSDES